MSQVLIFFPVVVMVLLTFVVAVWLLRARFRAVAVGALRPSYFLLNRGGKPPRRLLQLEQHYQNLLEVPLLFYVLAIVAYVTGSVSPLLLGVAWGFVVTRLLHSWVHTGSNRLRWRMLSFSAGVVLLMLGWLLLVVRLLQSVPV
ncbi:MAG: MAPEG family protein [Gammaproteobacteria bacterium]|nr:MAPEG family protein [Gammaproteobacteria bacterium]